MAVSKTKVSEETKVVTKKEVIKDIDKVKQLEVSLQTEREEKKAMQDQLNQLQNMMLKLMNNQSLAKTSYDEEMVKVQSNGYGRITLLNKDKSVALDFMDCGTIETISSRELDTMMTTFNKDFFRNGIISFVGDSDSYYDKYLIKRPEYKLDSEGIKSLYEMEYDDLIKVLDKLTNNKKNDLMTATIFWQTIRLIAKGELTNTYVHNILRQYFEVAEIDNCIGKVNLAKDLNFIQ